MRHRKSGKHLGRTSAHRKALMRNLSISLFEHEMIKTTLPKAKELRRVAEPLITLAKQDTVANRRLAFNRLRNKAAVGKLFSELGPRFKDRPGGYSRVLKMGFRAGDSAPMALVELVDREISSEAESEVLSNEAEAQRRSLVADLEEVPTEAQEEQSGSAEDAHAAAEAQASEVSEDAAVGEKKEKEKEKEGS